MNSTHLEPFSQYRRCLLYRSEAWKLLVLDLPNLIRALHRPRRNLIPHPIRPDRIRQDIHQRMQQQQRVRDSR